MASNGYVRKQCKSCIFYRTDREIGHECIVYTEAWGLPFNNMQWVSANDCDSNPEMKEKYYEKCEHFFSKRGIRDVIRASFGIKVPVEKEE